MEYVPLHRVVKNSISIVCMITVLAMGTGTILQFSQNSEIKENFHNVDEIDAKSATQFYHKLIEYGLEISISRLIETVQKSDMYYDAIMEAVYIDYDTYFEEI